MNGPQLLAHVGRHQETYLILPIPFKRFRFHDDLKAHLIHIQIPQFCQNPSLQIAGSLFPRFCKPVGSLLCHITCSMIFLLKPQQRIVGILNFVQFRMGTFQVSQHIRHGGTIFLFQPIDFIQSPFNPIQLRR